MASGARRGVPPSNQIADHNFRTFPCADLEEWSREIVDLPRAGQGSSSTQINSRASRTKSLPFA